MKIIPGDFKDSGLLKMEFVVNSKCRHLEVIVDQSLSTVTCKKCGEGLNPMWVLHRLAIEESRFSRDRENYLEAKDALDKRKRTTCEHCGKMTRIKGF